MFFAIPLAKEVALLVTRTGGESLMPTKLAIRRPRRRRTSVAARNRLALRHMPLVKYAFGKMSLYCPNHLSREDLTSSGVIGLIKAAQEYDPRNLTRFSTFAIPRIRGSILDELRAHDWVPRSVKRKMRCLEAAREKLDRRLAGAPSERHLAREMQLSKRQLHKVLALSTPVSLLPFDSAFREDGDRDSVALADTLKNPKAKNPLAELAAREEESSLGESILQLPEADRMIVTLHYYKGMMLKDIARLMKLSKSRVSQIHKQALERLRAKMRNFEPAHVP